MSSGTLSPPSISAGPSSSDHTPSKDQGVESLRSELSEKVEELSRKELELVGLREGVAQTKQEGGELRGQVAALKDKLNVSEVSWDW